MTLRHRYRPLRPDLDCFLFSEVGDERRAVPLSVVLALTRLGLDPWQEAVRLSSLSKGEAVEQLARLIAELPDTARPPSEARPIAAELVRRPSGGQQRQPGGYRRSGRAVQSDRSAA